MYTYCDVFALGELKNSGLPVHPQFPVKFAPTIRQKKYPVFRNDKAILDIFAEELWVQILRGIVGAPANHYFSVHQEQIRHNRYTCTGNHWSELAAASRRASPAINCG